MTAAVCRGSWVLGSACGHCQRCADTALEGARILQAQAKDLRANARQQAITDLGKAFKTFAPDLAGELVVRFQYAKLTPDQRLERFLEVLREPSSAA